MKQSCCKVWCAEWSSQFLYTAVTVAHAVFMLWGQPTNYYQQLSGSDPCMAIQYTTVVHYGLIQRQGV